jgi:LPXTG-motif cell wall-anchored protein
MSATRRILMAGLPAAAALFFAASPALAVEDHPARPPAATVTPCTEDARGGCGYGHQGGGSVSGAAASITPSATEPTRGTGGYETTPPTTPPGTLPTSPAPSGTGPTAQVFTVPPTGSSPTPGTGVKPASVAPSSGVSAGHALPVTGAPMGPIVAAGALMVAGGGAAIWFARRRRAV